MNSKLTNILNILILAFLVLMSAYLYPDLPERLPSNFNIDGEVQLTRAKELMVILVPSLFLGVMIALNVVVKISPKNFSMPNSKRALDITIFGTGLMLCFLHYGLLMNAGDYQFLLQNLSWGLAIFMLVAGNVLGKTERNFMLGLRLPWTIDSPANWRATHRLCGRLSVIAGTILFILSFFVVNLFVLLSLTLSPFLIAAIYSFYYFQANERQV